MSGGEEMIVGDLVCESRGAPKPKWNPEARHADDCVPLPAPRGQRPSAQCMQEAQAVVGSEAVDAGLFSAVDLDMDFLAGSVPAALALAAALAA